MQLPPLPPSPTGHSGGLVQLKIPQQWPLGRNPAMIIVIIIIIIIIINININIIQKKTQPL